MTFSDLTPAELSSFIAWERATAVDNPEQWCPGFNAAATLEDIQRLCQTIPGYEAWSLENLAAYLRSRT